MTKLLFILLLLFGCSTKNIEKTNTETTCLVLSVGAEKGIAHTGAIEALRDLGYEFDYVYGNSAGSLAGSIYANNPDANMRKEFYRLCHIYINKTIKKAENSAIGGGALGILAGMNPFGVLLMAGLSATTINKLDFDRFQDTLFKYFKTSEMDGLKIPFGTSYWDLSNTENFFQFSKEGYVAEMVSYSCQNPLIFKDFKKLEVDAGADRIASTPILDAYEMFKPDKIIAINVSGQNAFYTGAPCEVNVIKINTKEAKNSCNIDRIDDLESLQECVNKMYDLGYKSVLENFNKTND
tara:strand:- start:35 stop:919 length:885 start_codon:yes stop_codon:yes gene_type:complete